ncbi:Bacteroidetes-specific putative membrane protein [Bacteroidales bacterium 6E]|nr:Bacteroidetes-specific putative membrane protein [Bacteroidales bacterium 6E]
MLKQLKYLVLMAVMAATLEVKAQQDPIFTQYMFNIQAVNPAYAGMWEKIGFISLVRKQWAGIEKSPFTQMVSFHSPVFNEYAGIGLNVINDRFAYEERLSIFADYAYELLVTPEKRLRLGMKFGFMNYKNPLRRYQLYPDYIFDPAFQEDIDLKFLPNFGIGVFYYDENFYVSASIPKLVKNDFVENRNNYSSLAEVRHFYMSGGYVFTLNPNLKFKPTAMMRGALGAPVQIDLSANFMLNDRLWLGAMVRTGDALCFVAQWIFNNNIRIGYAMDITFTEIYRHQNGTYEFTLSYDVDFYGRSYLRSRYF